MKKLLSILIALSFSFALGAAPDISGTVVAGNPVIFALKADGTPPFTYQWLKDSVKIPGAIASTYSIAAASPTSAGTYTATITNGAGTITTPKAVLSVTLPAIAPVITQQPKGLTAMSGSSATFSVVASGTGPFTYQWQKDGVNWQWPNDSATTATFTNPNLNASDAGIYTCVVTGPGGSVTSNGAALIVVTVTLPSVLSFTITTP